MGYTYTICIIWIIWLVVLLRFYHKVFIVYYFDLGSGLAKEFFISAFLSGIMTGLTLYFWWLTAIIIVLFGLGTAKKTSNSLVLIGYIILAVIISVIGIRFKNEMKEGEDVEINELSDAYLDDELSDTYFGYDMSKNTDVPDENEMSDTEYYDSQNDIMDQMFENARQSENSLTETYVDEEEGISFMYPDEWKLVDSDMMSNYHATSDIENVIVSLASTSEDTDEINARFMVSKLQENEISMDELLIDDEEFKEMLVETVDNELLNVQTSVIELDGIPARVVSFDAEGFVFRMYFYGVNSDIYQINFCRRQDDNYLESDLDAVMDTYTITAVEHESDAAYSGYILENSDSQYLTRADLEGLSADDCRLARNELYARHGRRFNDEDMQDYFDACSWYQGVIEPDDFQESMLNEIEIANRDLIIIYEKEMGYR